ncbi:c-type cytochrome [bacterium]|nr:c-type cytochrome [bacterium]
MSMSREIHANQAMFGWIVYCVSLKSGQIGRRLTRTIDFIQNELTCGFRLRRSACQIRMTVPSLEFDPAMTKSRLLTIVIIAFCCSPKVAIRSSEPVGAARTGTTLKAFSVLPGEWIAYSDKPVEQKDLDPFVGRYLLAGTWPAGVTGPDDPRVLLGQGRLAATSIVGLKAEAGGRRIRLTADPVVSPEVYRLKLGEITLEATFTGLAANIGPNLVEDATHDAVLPRLTDRKGLAEMAKLDDYVARIEKAWNDPKTPLTLRGWLRLVEGPHKLQFASARSFTITVAGTETVSGPVGDRFEAVVDVESTGMEQDISWVFPADKGPIHAGDDVAVCALVGSDDRKPLPESSLLTPWVPESMPETPTALTPPPYELTGGDPEKGRAVFESATARCLNCHMVDGKGGKIGPDLSGLKGARPELIFHHINAPSDRIHPAYPSFSVALRGGQVTMGVVRAVEREMLEILDTDARSQRVSSFDVTEIRPSSSSIMPSGLAGALGEPAMRDLIAFLTRRTAAK